MKRISLSIAILTLIFLFYANPVISQSLIIKVGDKSFTATLYDNSSTLALKNMLPLDMNMSELNNNEKYYYLPISLPVSSSMISVIREGDIMLYQSNYLVLFYKTFNNTSYRYTKLGYVDNPEGLAAALGNGNVDVSFSLNVGSEIEDIKIEKNETKYLIRDSHIYVEADNSTFYIIDTRGRLIKESSTSIMNISDIESGFYILLIEVEGKRNMYKIFI